MLDRIIYIKAACCVDGGDDMAADARVRYKAEFPGRRARRMTHLGLLTGLCIRELEIEEDTPLIYASAFAESASLEAFIDSFPQASPMLFQTSIHPSAVEQALIGQRRSLRRFYPITAEADLGGLALQNLLELSEDRGAILVGGEERGTWLRPFGLASDDSFAFALQTGPEEPGSLGRIDCRPIDGPLPEQELGLTELREAIDQRRDIETPSAALQAWIRLSWK